MSQRPDTIVDISETAMRETARKVCAARPGVEPQTALAVIQVLLVMGWRPAPVHVIPLDSRRPA